MFKVGDKIKVTGLDIYLDVYRNKTGVISSTCNDKKWPWNISVPGCSQDEICVGEGEIELLLQVGQQLLLWDDIDNV